MAMNEYDELLPLSSNPVDFFYNQRMLKERRAMFEQAQARQAVKDAMAQKLQESQAAMNLAHEGLFLKQAQVAGEDSNVLRKQQADELQTRQRNREYAATVRGLAELQRLNPNAGQEGLLNLRNDPNLPASVRKILFPTDKENNFSNDALSYALDSLEASDPIVGRRRAGIEREAGLDRRAEASNQLRKDLAAIHERAKTTIKEPKAWQEYAVRLKQKADDPALSAEERARFKALSDMAAEEDIRRVEANTQAKLKAQEAFLDEFLGKSSTEAPSKPSAGASTDPKTSAERRERLRNMQ